MRVLIEEINYGDGIGDVFWKPIGDFEVIAETSHFYKIKRSKQVGLFIKRTVQGTQWFPKEGGHTRCSLVKQKGWRVE